ncbi:MAG: N-acetylmuramoyl-L-alanine amidase, partial [Planktomarina sp.]
MGSTPIPCGGVQLIWHPSPNFGPRKDGGHPRLIVLHYTAMDTAQAAIDRLCDPEFEVSAHYVIDQMGHITQLVAEDARAWHAGAGQWGQITDVNSSSIGIEMCNRGDHAFPLAQMTALKGLIGDIQTRWAIAPHQVIGHSDMAPGRKKDPGRWFDWAALAGANLAVFRGDDHPTVLPFLPAAAMFGYGVPDDKAATDMILEAFRQRFRPDVSGPIQ